MVWNKMKQYLESFLSPALVGRVEYRATGYRYLPDKSGRCYIAVDKKEVFNMNDVTTTIRWHQTEQDIKNDPEVQIPINKEDIERLKQDSEGLIPDERLALIVRSRKVSVYAKELLVAQAALCKSDFYAAANKFLSDNIENSLESKDILLNVFALVDRRVGKKRLLSMQEKMLLKHPIVQFFYDLRCRSL